VGQWCRIAADRLDGLADQARVGSTGSFPPEHVSEVKAVACEPPAKEGVPLSRRSVADVHRLVIERGICEASASTIVRWLREDAIRPWQYRSDLPDRPDFAVKAGRILDLYSVPLGRGPVAPWRHDRLG
jgi:hypothetical protein